MATRPIPGVASRPWFKKKWVLEVVGSVPPAIAAFVGAVKLEADPATATLAFVSFGAAGWLVVAAALKSYAAHLDDAEAGPDVTHEGLRGALTVLHAAVAHACAIDDPQRNLRVTFHRVVPPIEAPDEIEQIVDYVGDDGGGRGRRFSVRSGVTGRAIRSGKPVVGTRQSDDEQQYREELRTVWSYTADEIKAMKLGRYAWMAVPVTGRDGPRPIGVVFLDSSVKTAFESPEHRAAVILACTGLTRYVGERYSS